jgi:uncharacterized protein with PQ loop repeat
MEEQRKIKRRKKVNPFWRAVLEAGFIIFLFYSNLLMGEFTGSGPGKSKGFLFAIQDIFTQTNVIIAFFAAFIGYLGLEFFRKKL